MNELAACKVYSLQQAGAVASRLKQREATAIYQLWEEMLEVAPLEADLASAIADEAYDTWREGVGRKASPILAGRYKTCLRGLALAQAAQGMAWAVQLRRLALGPWTRESVAA